jgi:hypothetical protein
MFEKRRCGQVRFPLLQPHHLLLLLLLLLPAVLLLAALEVQPPLSFSHPEREVEERVGPIGMPI